MEPLTSQLQKKLYRYVERFNRQDAELFPQLIPNDRAAEYLARQIPLLDCPDGELEEIYYFRWWTLRKHWKNTEKGHILTEFLPRVPWSGPYNSINCPACLHIREGRWLADPQNWLREYISFWLDGHGDLNSYSAWYAHALWEYCALRGDTAFGVEKLPQLVQWYLRREATHRAPCGLYWSVDDLDGMEYSISGSGLRPTINAYAYGDAVAIGKFAALAGDAATAEQFQEKAEAIKTRVEHRLWDGDFYKTIPADGPAASLPLVRPARRDVRELVGYVPWYFGLPEPGKAGAFRWLMRPDGFAAPAGLTTAEQSHPRFMEAHDHECLWNGPVWPFATSQTLVAAANMLRSEQQTEFTKEDYYALLLQYARSHHRVDGQGNRIPWIDENMDPYTGRWLARDILESWGWKPEIGGYERGKDYNHSLFCDLVLDGLLGIGADAQGNITVSPMIPHWWQYFAVENVMVQGSRYSILYDRDGSHYGIAPGLHIRKLQSS